MRRMKFLRVHADLMFGALLGGRVDGNAVVFHVTDGIPPETQVVAVTHDPFRNEFVFRLYNPSFPIVGNGEQVPELGPLVKTYNVSCGCNPDIAKLIGIREPPSDQPKRGREFI
jgi:hypothetical protein